MSSHTTISRTSIVAMAVTALLMLGVFVFPLWVIHLKAPQYPQGLGIHIWIDRIEGAAPHDLQNINGLNHYIGMQAIEPDAIPELRFMKYFAAGLAALAGVAALIRRKWALLGWAVLAVALSGIGMYDFYKWEYNYGHNLNPEAAIKIAGMSYQPPMFGTRQLLNFHTTAWPGIGGVLAMIGVALGSLTAIYEWFHRGRLHRDHSGRQPAKTAARTAVVASIIAMLVAGAGCVRKPQSIAYGTDTCEYCSMTISNQRYGAVILTTKGRTHKFDSVECMIESTQPGGDLANTEVRAYFVVDYATKTLVDAATAKYVVSEKLPSPMGANLTAFATEQNAEHVKGATNGELYDWNGMRAYLLHRGAAEHGE